MRSNETTVGVRHEAKTLGMKAVAGGGGNWLLPHCCRTSGCSGAPAAGLFGSFHVRRGRPLILGVRQHAFREVSAGWGWLERALHEFGLRAGGVGHHEALWWEGRSGTVRVDTELSQLRGMALPASALQDRSPTRRQIENTEFSRCGIGLWAGGPCALLRGAVVVAAHWKGSGCGVAVRWART